MRRVSIVGLAAILGFALALAFALAPGAPPEAGADGAPSAASADGRAADGPAVAATPDTTCSALSPCPAPVDSASPEVTCYEPKEVSQSTDPVLDIYGRHLVGKDSSVSHLAYRPTRMERGGQTNDDVEVHSACHVSAKLYLARSPNFWEGDTLEFLLVREKPSLEERRQGEKGIISDWHRVQLKP